MLFFVIHSSTLSLHLPLSTSFFLILIFYFIFSSFSFFLISLLLFLYYYFYFSPILLYYDLLSFFPTFFFFPIIVSTFVLSSFLSPLFLSLFYNSFFFFPILLSPIFFSSLLSSFHLVFSSLYGRETSSINASRINYAGYGLFRQFEDEECSSVASSFPSQASSKDMRWKHYLFSLTFHTMTLPPSSSLSHPSLPHFSSLSLTLPLSLSLSLSLSLLCTHLSSSTFNIFLIPTLSPYHHFLPSFFLQKL